MFQTVRLSYLQSSDNNIDVQIDILIYLESVNYIIFLMVLTPEIPIRSNAQLTEYFI